MKKLFILFLMFIVIVDASWLRFLRGKSKNRKIQPFESDEGSIISPETEAVTKRSLFRIKVQKTNKVFPDTPLEEDEDLEMDQIFVDLERNQFNTSVERLKNILAPKITEGYETLSEESAQKLLKISQPLQYVLYPKNRFDVASLNLDLKINKKANELFKFIEKFGTEIESINDLSEYLKMTLKFYKKFSALFLKMCVVAIM